MKRLTAEWTGIRPLLMHNGRLADPLEPFAIKIDAINKDVKKKKTPTGQAERSRLEWEGSLYWDSELGVCIPSENIERCIQLGAQKIKRGKDVKACVLCSEPSFKIEYDGPADVDGLWADSRFRMTKGVVVNGRRIMRSRPVIPTGWRIKIKLMFDEDIIPAKDMQEAMVNAGKFIGLGDWRPKFGRFEVSNVKEKPYE